jgi:hypothetical protein|tara:strand:+ start:5512 stop:20706 length:15195 start_codon:yes stop_codon:yes gene_type:complete
MADPINVENNNSTTEGLDVSNALEMPSGIDNAESSLAPEIIETPYTSEVSNVPDSPGIVNFENTYPDLNGYDPMLFEESVDVGIQTQGMPNLELNQPFFDMIDRAAVDLNKYPVLFSNNNMDDLFPGRAGTDFDPFRTSSGVPDLNSANGIKAYLSGAVEFTKQIKPNTTPGYKDPFYYSARRYELDRYYRHPKFADLGFHPFADNEAYYQANSSKWDNFTRSRAAFSDMYGPAFTSNWRSISDMFTGDIAQSDMSGATAMDDSMRIGRSSSGGMRGFFNDLFVNSSYTVGILSSIAVEEAALWGAVAIQGGLNPAMDAVAIARTAKNSVTSANALRRLFSMKRWKSGGKKMLHKLGQIDNARSFWHATRSGGKVLGEGLGRMFGPETLYQLKHIKTSAKAGDNLTQMAKANRLFGGFYRDVRAVNLAWAESKMEGGLVEMEMHDELYQEIYNLKGGVDPSIAEMEMLVSDARAAALTTQLINLPIIYLSNKIVLDGALRGFKPLGRIADESLSGPLGRIIFKQGTKKGADAFTDAGRKWIVGDNMRRMWKAGFKGSAKHMAATGLRYTAANFAEGIQELSQEATANGVKSYFKSLYDTPIGIDADMKLAEMTDSYSNARKSMLGDYDYTDRAPGMSIMDSVKKGAGSQMSGQGFHTFMSGFMMGGMIQGPQKVLMETIPNLFRYGKDKVKGTTEFADARAKEDEMITNAVESLNKIYENPETYFDIRKLNLMTQKELNTGMFEAAGADDITSFMDMKDHSIFNHLYTVMATGQMGAFRDQMKSFEKLDDIDIKEAFESMSSTPDKIRGRVSTMLKRMDEVEEGYKKLSDEYINPYKPKAFKKGTRKYHEEALRAMAFEHAKMMAMFTQDTFKQSLIRANSVMETLSSDPVLATISASDITALTSRQGLAKEIALLKKELSFSSTSQEEKIIRDKKKKKLELLENYEKIFNAQENQAFSNGQMFFDQYTMDGKTYQKKEGRNIGFYDKRKMGKLKPAFVAYLQFLAESNDDFIVSEKIEETLKKIVDHGYLKGRAADFHKAASVLMDKNTLYEMTDRLSVIMKSVWEEHRDKNNLTKRVKSYVGQVKRLAFLKELGEKGIQPDAEQTKLFLEDGTIPYDYFDEEGKVTKSSDPAAWMIVEGLQENYRQSTKVEKAESEDQTTTERQNTENADQSGNDSVNKENAEPDFESVIGRSKYQAFYMQDKGTKDIIDALYEEYKKDWNSQDGPLLSKNKWAVSESGGKNIIKSRYELNELYNSQSEDVTEKFPTLDDWIIGNQRNPLIVGTNGILKKNGVTISDVSTELVKEKGVKKDKLSSNEKVISTDKTSGLSVIETTIFDDNNKPEVFYTIVDNNTKNAVDKYKTLDPEGKKIRRSYTSKAEALTALKFIQNNMPQSGTFPFAGQNFSTTDIVVDSAGNEWMVRSSPNMMRNNKNLYVVPVKKAKSKKGKDDREYLTEDRWRKEGWTKKGDEKVDLTSSLTTKLTSYEPIKIYPFDGSKVREGYILHDQYPAPKDADQQFQDNLKSLTEEERKNLTLVVEKNPFYDKFKKDLQAGRLKAKLPNETYSVNESILQGQNEFEVTIMSGNIPIGKLMGIGTSILLDVDGTSIIGSQITAEQAQRLFIIPYGQSADEAAALIRRNYAKAELITSELAEKLGKNQSLKINISKLDNIELNVTPGYTGYRVDNNGEPTLKQSGKNASTPWADVQEANYEGEIIIFDTRRERKNNRRSTRRVWSIDPFSTEGKKIDAEILKNLQGRGLNSIADLNMGRYVQVIKHPNGSMSFVELKLDRLSSEAVSDIAQDIKNKQQEILEKNFKDGKYIDKPASKQRVVDINAELQESFYMLSEVSGDDISLFFNEFGQLIFKGQRSHLLLASGITRSIALDADVMAGVTDAKTFVETLNANWIANEKGERALHKKSPTKANNVDGAFLPFKLKISTDSFTPNLPLNVQNAETIIEAGVSVRVIPSVIWGQLADLNYTNNANIQKELNAFGTNETQTEEPTVVVEEETTTVETIEEDVLTDEVFQELMANEFENVPEEIINGIKRKVIENKEFTPQEQMIVDAYQEMEGKEIISPEEVSDAIAAIKKDKEGLQAESDNPTVIDQILAKKEEIAKKKVSLENEYRAEIKKANPAISTGKLNLQVENMLEVDDQVKKLEAELAKLQSNIGYKIVNEFDSRDVEDIDTFIEWAQKNLPDFINIQDIDGLARRLKANGVTLGAFVMSLKSVSGGIESLKGNIYIGKENPYKYHESFHAVFRMLMNEEDIQKYLNIAKKDVLKQMRSAEGYEILPGTFVKTMEQARVILKGLSKSYAVLDNKTLDERVLEEYLADEFEKFKTNPRSSRVQSEVKSLFTRILEWIKNIFIAPNNLEYNALFTSIDSGQYKNAAIQENRFTLSAMEGLTGIDELDNSVRTGVPSNIALKAIRKGDPIATTRPAIVDGKIIPDGRTIFINNYFTQSETNGIIAQVGALYMNKIDDLSTNPDFKGSYNPSSILEEVVNDFIEDYNPARSSIDADGNETFFYADRSNWSSFKDRLKERYKSLKEYKADVISSTNDYLTLFDIDSSVESEILEKTDMSADGSVKTTEEYESAANEIGGATSLSKANRKFIATTTKQIKDEFTGDMISVPVDYITAYNALMKALSGITNPQIMLIKLKLFEQSNPDASAIINAIFDKVNLSNVTLEDFINGNYNLKQITNASFFQGIIKGFSQFRSDYLYIETDTDKGLVNIFKANHRDDASSQTDVWQENYTSKLEKLNNDPAFVASAQAPWESINFNAGKKRISEKELDESSRKIANAILNTIGIDMSYLAIKYLILSNGVSNKTKAQTVFVSTFTNDLLEFNSDDISEMSIAISNHGLTINGLQKGNLFYDMNEESVEVNEDDVNIESTDVKSKIKKLAQVNAIFDSNVGATVFRNPEGKLIYAHQMPTYDLEKVAELNSEHALDNLMEGDGFLKTNYLLNNDKFRQLAIEGKLRISRVSGQKLVELDTDDVGNFKSSNGIDLDKKATSFGSSTPKDFISQMMNLYLSNYNSLNGKVEETQYDTTDDFGKKVNRPFTTSLVNITVIAESNTADFIPAPIVFAVEMDDGKSELTDEYVNNIETEIENEYNRIDREVNQKEGYTEDDLKGYNDFDPQDINDEDVKVDRAAKFFKTNELLKNKTQSTQALRTVGEEINISGGPLEIESLATGTSIFLRDGKVLAKLGLNQGETVLSPIYTLKGAVPTTEIYAVTYRGVQSAETYDLNKIKDILGNDMSEVKNAKNKYRVDFGTETFHVRTTRQRDWLNGTDFGVIEIVPQSEIETVDTTIGIVPVITDNSIIDALQKAAREGEETYAQAKKRIEEETGVNIRDLVKSRLMEEFEEFNTIIGPGQTQAINQVDRRLLTKLETAEGKTNKNTNNSMDLLNLKINNPDNHNLKQIFFSDYLNRLSIKQILLGDASRGLKDAVDEIKRAKALNAAGPNASSIVFSPNKYDNEGNIIGGHGVEHAVKHISLVTLTDVETPAKYGRTGSNDKPVTETDAQMWMTTKAFRYMMFGFGSLNSAQARILDRIELGEDISIDEFYGAGVSKQGYKELGAILNSKKLVYADGEVFLKMSAFVLTKQLASDPQTDFETALPGREDMHNLRMKLEQIESRGDETIAIAAPESASKMIKKNIISYERAFDSNTELDAKDVTDLDARWMRLQQISPSNKGTIIDPTQIKQLITSEQDDSIMVTIGGKKMPIGDVRKLYNKSIGDRVEIKYLNRRNLIFDFEKGQDELQESINAGEVTVDLQSFLGYAQESLSTAGARAQFLELFEVDKTGSPKFDLNNPITINKFQELFMSFFSNGVLSEKVNGESIALVSGQGMKVIKKVIALDETTGQPSRWEVIRMDDYAKLKNRPEIAFNNWSDKVNKTFNGIKVGDIYVDELRANVRDYDKDGNPLETVHSEFMLPAYHPALKNIKPGDPIPEVIAKAFATRIPSQDKHSAINGRLVDFMPVFYGSSGVFPADLIEISGADFDIDKVYTQFKEFYMKDGKFVEYGATENVNQQYEEYLEYTIKESNKKGTSVNMAVKMWNTRGNVIDPILDNDVTLPSEQIIGALRILDMPVTIEEFKNYKKKHDNRLPYTAAQSNVALDAKYVLLGNEGMTKGRNGRQHGIAYEPAVLDPLEDVWNFIQSELPELAEQVSEEGVIVDNMVGMFKAWKNNKEGAGAIGSIVVPNIIFNLLKEYDISLRQTNNKGLRIKGGNIELNGYKYKSFKGDYAIDPETGKPLTQGTRKQFAISSLITAATDNAKERLLAKLGLNKDALAVVGTLLSVGVDIQTAILLINQPDIKKMYALAANKNKDTDPGIAGLVSDEMFQLEQLDDTVKSNAKKIDVTTELLMKHIRGEELENYQRYAILNQFAEARELKTYVGNVQALVTKVAGLDRGMQEMYESFERIDKLGIELGVVQFKKNIKIPFDARKIFKGNLLQSRYYKIFKNIQQLTPSVFVTETLEFKKILSTIISNINQNSRSPERVSKVNKDILSYLIGKGYMTYLNNTGRALLTESLQTGMIYDEFAGTGLTINKVVENIRTYMKDKGGNDFINNFIFNKTTKNPNNKSGVNQAVMNTWSKLSPNQVTGLQNSLRDLYAEEAIRADVIHMIHYLLVKDGLQYSQGSFLSIIPAPMLDEILTVTKSINDVFNNRKISKQQYKNLFGINFTEIINEITEGYLSSRSNIYFLPEVKVTKFGVQKYSKGFEGKKQANKPIIYDEDAGTLEIRLFKLRGRKKKTKKGKHKEIPKGSTFEKAFIGTGVQLVEQTINGKIVKVMVLPLIKRMNVGTKRKPDFRTFKLDEVYSSKKIESSEISDPSYTPQMINYDQDFGIITGHRAVYKEFKTLGSMQTNAMGFVYGPRSTYEYLQEEQEKNDAAINDGTQDSMLDKIANQNQKPPSIVGPGTNTSIVATNDAVTVVETNADNQKVPVSLSKLEKMSKEGQTQLEFDDDDFVMPNAMIPEGRGVTFTKDMAIGKETKEPGQNKKLEDWYNDLTKIQKAMLSRPFKEGGADISTAEELINDFNDSKVLFNEDDYMEQLKKCYTN